MLLGAHVSVAGGYPKALDYALEVGCECAQIFAKSPRQWRGPSLDPEVAARFIESRMARGFGPVFTHTAYLINPATNDPELREKSIAALADELVRGSLLGAAGVVTHVGNDPAGDPAAAAARVGSACVEAFERAGGAECKTRLLLENTAGAGRTFGSDFDQLGASIAESGLPVDRLGVCLDTCHAWAFGMDVATPEGWREVVSQIETHCGVERLGLIHANDCLFERGSRRDRHAWIGDGHIGSSGFEAMVCVPELAGVCAVTEMPGEVPEKDAVNIGRLSALRDACSS
ncbi:MAG: deoxyribonuclease IV [Coriobacteriia bacterium]|nr:deoxyribonuclease IV [Coriobacteriia bacterium]